MYRIEWDTETGGVTLNTRVIEATLGVAPRPVFYEELDLLGLNAFGYEYPRGKEPIMWAVNKQYWYHGQHIFDAKGANIYNKPTLEFANGQAEPCKLAAVDMEGMLTKVSDLMFVLENEAIEFIRDTYTTYTKVNGTYDKADANKLDFEALAEKVSRSNKQKMAVVKQDCDSFDIMPLSTAEDEGKKVLLSTKIDRFIASFSGGKDSQVVLDLCTRAIPPTDFEVIYSDTGYELPPSLDLYKEVTAYYQERFPALKFHLARNHENVLNYWDKIGTPSDTHRWCCSIMKTTPLYRHLKEGLEGNPKFLAFEGVRAEESVKRNDYNRIGKGVKHNFVVNARPILKWNTTEVFIYLFRHELPINPAYRVGKPRVGCILCPFGSPWDDMIVNTCYKENLAPFLSRLDSIVKDRKIPNAVEYIADRKWKMRGSGKFSDNTTSVSIKTHPDKWEASVANPQKTIIDWLPALGKYTIRESKSGINGELLFKKEVFQFEIRKHSSNDNFVFAVYDNNNVNLRFMLRRLVNKAAHCINCEACELECPTGALSVLPEIKIDTKKCINCHKCLQYHNVGCIVADSLQKPSVNNLSNMKISKYGTFGMHQEWLDMYLADSETFFTSHLLGDKQYPSFKAWLKDAEIIDDKGNITPFGEMCKEINENSQTLLWEIIHINLVHNSPLMKWFAPTILFDKDMARKELDQLALDFFQSTFKNTTITYAIQALMQTFKYSPIGEELTQCVPQDSKGTVLRRIPYNDLSPEAVAYSIYKYARAKELNMLRVSDLYRTEETNGVYKEFGIAKNELLKQLRYLTTEKNKVLTAELNMGLEHITLRDDLQPISVLQALLA